MVRDGNYDRLPLFKPGSPLTSLSAEEMNRRIVRPLNVLLRTVAKPPLKLIRSDAGLLLIDTTVAGVGEQPAAIRGSAPAASCALPGLSELIGARIDTDETGLILIQPLVSHTFACAYVLEIDFEASVPRWVPAFSQYAFYLRDDGGPGNAIGLAQAIDDGLEGEMQTVTGTVQVHIDHSTTDEFYFFWSAFGYDEFPVGYCEILDARFVSSTL